MGERGREGEMGTKKKKKKRKEKKTILKGDYSERSFKNVVICLYIYSFLKFKEGKEKKKKKNKCPKV